MFPVMSGTIKCSMGPMYLAKHQSRATFSVEKGLTIASAPSPEAHCGAEIEILVRSQPMVGSTGRRNTAIMKEFNNGDGRLE